MRSIEYASKDDGPAILAVTQRVGIFSQKEQACVKELWTAWQADGEASGYCFLLAAGIGRKAEGYACFGPHPLTDGTYDLYWIAVDPDHQGEGVGRSLLARVEVEVQQRGGRLVLIETSDNPSYAAARRLYEAAGYQCEAHIDDFYSRGDRLLVYAKHLDLTVANDRDQIPLRMTDIPSSAPADTAQGLTVQR